MLTRDHVRELVDKSYRNRLTLLNVVKRCGKLHIGGASSALEILTVLYEKVLKHDPKDPQWDGRDVFLLSAGHKAVAHYIVLQSRGYFEEDVLWTYNSLHSKVPTHPDAELLDGVEFSTGSLGHGLPVAGGIAIAFKDEGGDRKVFVLMGDGEAAEGSIWEAALSAVKYKLDNLVVVIDVNGLQGEGFTHDILPIVPFEDKYRAFGWSTRTIDGHDVSQIHQALAEAPYEKGKPTCIVANTIKAKGIDFAEGTPEFHMWRSDQQGVEEAIESVKASHKREIERLGHDH